MNVKNDWGSDMVKIIPAIDIMQGQVVRLYRGDPSKKTVYGDDPVATAKQWESQGAHMLHVVDLDATLSMGSNSHIIHEIARAVSIPVQVAGGLRDEGAVSDMLAHANRVVIGTLALDTVALQILLDRYGKRMVVSVDHNNGNMVTHGWRRDSGLDMISAMARFVSAGVTQFLVTDVSRDGTLSGPDMKGLSRACAIGDVIASGGISGPADVWAVSHLNPYGVILGKALYEKRLTIPEVLQC